MKRKACWILLTIVLIMGIAMARVGKADPGPIIQVEPQNNKADPGETFSIDITVADIVVSDTPPMSNGLLGWETWMTFDPNVVHAVNVTRGSFLKDAASEYGYDTIFSQKINNTKGTVTVGETVTPKMPPDDPYPPVGATGDGILTTITFEVQAQGTTQIHFETPKEVAKTNLYTVIASNLVQISYTAEDGAFDNRSFVLSTELIVAIVVVVGVACVATVFIYRRRRASAET